MEAASRITIGPFMPEDYAPVFCWMNDGAAARLDYGYKPVEVTDHREWWRSLGRDPSKIVFAIRRNDTLALVGYLQITEINTQHRSAVIALRIGDEHNRGRGYGKEALRLAVDFCWNHLNLNRLQLTVFRNNDRAIRACQVVGFRTEGLLKKAAYVDGRWLDVVLMAALRPAQTFTPRLRPSSSTGKTVAEARAARLRARGVAA